MEQIQQQINFFHMMFVICLILALICLGLSVFFFFRFKILNIFNIKTGRSVKKSVEKVNEMNAKTGQLRQMMPNAHGKKSQKLTKPQPSLDLNTMNPNAVSNLSSVAGFAAATDDSGSDSTAKLDYVQPETMVLNQGKPEESVDGFHYSIEIAQDEVDQQYGKFVLKTSVMLIHTKEVIER